MHNLPREEFRMRHIYAAIVVFLIAVSSLTSTVAQGAILYGYRLAGQRIISFDSENPGTLLSDIAANIPLEFTELLGLDFRPATGQLYSLYNNFVTLAVYTVDPVSGIAVRIGSGGLALPGGTAFGMAFNPLVDRIRLIDNLGNNRRYNPTTGDLAGTDTTLAYVAGDPGDPGGPNVTHIAYSTATLNASGLLVTTLYGIDATRNTLVRIGGVDGNPSPNSGAVTTIGSLGVGGNLSGGFVITPRTNKAYAVLNVGAGAQATLYEINLATGAATFRGVVGTGLQIDGLAVKDTSSCYDLDGDGKILPTTDGLLLLRAMLGMTGASVTANALPTPAPPRSTWTAIRNHLNANCGLNFSP
jgi:Domain of unknown function (DUF4394)